VTKEKEMYRVISGSAFALLIAGSVFAAPSGPKPVLDPAQGDGGVSAFYVWDKEVPGTLGQLLRQEPLPEKLMLANASKSVRVLYISTNGIDGKTPITVSGAVYLPKGQVPSGGWPVVAWAHGTTGIADVCAPSWAPRSQRDTDYLNAWLAQGYAIVATDYQGLGTPGGHPWMTAKPEAYSVLDSIRSALGAFRELSNSVVIVGQSQGAHAALSASLLANRYARGLNLRGTVATGVPAIPPFAPATKAPQIPVPPLPGAGLLAVLRLFTFLALDHSPDFKPFDYLGDDAKAVFEAARTGCTAEVAKAADQHRVTAENAFKRNPDAAAAKAAPFQQYPTPRFIQPVFIGTGLSDITTAPDGQYNFVRAACHTGSIVEQHYYPGKDHSGTVNASLVDSIPFVKKILAGQRIDGNCGTVKPPPSGN
jgi:pimeloyl-ACP methyl ester carboxylesterase